LSVTVKSAGLTDGRASATLTTTSMMRTLNEVATGPVSSKCPGDGPGAGGDATRRFLPFDLAPPPAALHETT